MSSNSTPSSTTRWRHVGVQVSNKTNPPPLLPSNKDQQQNPDNSLYKPITDEEGRKRGFKMFGYNRGLKLYTYSSKKYLELRALHRVVTKIGRVNVQPRTDGYVTGLNMTLESWEKLKSMIPVIDKAFATLDVNDDNKYKAAMDIVFGDETSNQPTSSYHSSDEDTEPIGDEDDDDDYEEVDVRPPLKRSQSTYNNNTKIQKVAPYTPEGPGANRFYQQPAPIPLINIVD